MDTDSPCIEAGASADGALLMHGRVVSQHQSACRPLACLGACVLLPYNCLLTLFPSFDEHFFKGLDFPFAGMLVFSCNICVMQILLTFKGELLAVNARMLFAFCCSILSCTCLAMIAYMADIWSVIPVYCVSLSLIGVLAVSCAFMQSALQGLAGTLGPECSAAVMIGLGISGLASLGISLAVQFVLAMVHISNQPRTSSTIMCISMFAICVLYSVLSMWLYFRYMSVKVPAVVAVLSKLEITRRDLQCPNLQQQNLEGPCMVVQTLSGSTMTGGASPLPFSPLGADREFSANSTPFGTNGPPRSTNTDSVKALPPTTGSSGDRACNPKLLNENRAATKIQGRLRSVVRDIAPQAFNVWFTFVVTMCVFPGVVAKWEPTDTSVFIHTGQLFGTLLVGCYQTFDLLSRISTPWISVWMTPAKLLWLVLLRAILVPAFILGQRSPESCVVWGSDVGRFVLVASLAFTNGAAASYSFMIGPECCSAENRELAGMAMSCMMVIGILVGSGLAFTTQF